MRRVYRQYYLMRPKPTHYCYMDLEIDGINAGRLDFELFGEKAPKTVNNFLALCSGEMNRSFMWYKGTPIHKVHSGRWIMGGDIVNGNGTGSMTVYNEGKQKTFEAESNDLTFCEPYLLVASADD
jgi:peptidylprolyl isomerase